MPSFFDKTLDIAKEKDYNDKCAENLGVAQLVARYLGVVEAAGSNPVTQTKRPLLERGAVLCFIGDIWLTEWLCECGAALLIFCIRL